MSEPPPQNPPTTESDADESDADESDADESDADQSDADQSARSAVPSSAESADSMRRFSGRAVAVPWVFATAWSTAFLAVVIWSGADRDPAATVRPLQVHGEAEQIARPTIRVGSFNIHSAEGLDGVTDLERIAAVLRENQPELVGLNEVQGGFRTNQAWELGERLQMAAIFAGTEKRWWHDHFGNGVLFRRSVTEPLTMPLPSTGRKAFRNAIYLTVHVGGQSVNVLVTHIDIRTDRSRQLEVVLHLFRQLKPPAILLGDFNTKMDSPRLQELAQEPGVIDAVTIGAGPQAAAVRVDHIFVKGFRVLNAGVVPNDASDHDYVWADLEILPQETAAAKDSRQK